MEKSHIEVERVHPLIIAIPIYPGFTALDAVGPYEVLHLLPNATVKFIAHKTGLYNADLGMLSLQATATFEDVQRPDIIVVPGGPGTFAALKDEIFLNWIKKAHETSKYTTSVCTGSLLLAAAGLLGGLEATTHWSCYDDLAKMGAIPTEKRVVQQGKIVTSAGVSSGIDMAIKLAALLEDEETAKILQLFIEYDPQPPYDVGAPSKAGKELVTRTKAFLEEKMSEAHQHGTG